MAEEQIIAILKVHLLKPYEGKLQAWPFTTKMGRPTFNEAACVDAVAEKINR